MSEKRRTYEANYRLVNKERLATYRKAYFIKNKVRILAYRKEYKQQYKLKYPEKHHTATRNRGLRNNFGINLQQYMEILAKQNRQCLICSITPEQNGKDLAVDHNHTTGKIRGLLCAGCNVGIGYFKDSPELLQKAIGYLCS